MYSDLPHPVSGYDRAFVRSFRRAVPRQSCRDFDDQFADLLRGDRSNITDAVSQSHIVTVLAAVTCYRCLRSARMPDAEARAQVQHALTKPGAWIIRWATWLGARLSHDPLSFVEQQGRQKAQMYYGAAFQIDHHHSPGSYVIQIRRCAYVDVLARHRTPELGPVFCAWDRLWIDALPNRIGFARPCTLADGAPCCRFVFHDTCHSPVTPPH